MWRTASTLPVVGSSVGTRVFSLVFGQKAPYFSSIRPRFTVLEPDHAELVIPKRRAVHNHIGTVHAIALCNGLEAAMGALAERERDGRGDRAAAAAHAIKVERDDRHDSGLG